MWMPARSGLLLLSGLLALGLWTAGLGAEEGAVDFQRARALLRKQQQGQPLTEEERECLRRAMEARRAAMGRREQPRQTTGLVPLTEMAAADKYQGQDGGLYGQGQNVPPAALAAAARRELSHIRPLNAEGKPAADGRIVLMSIGMSNTTQEFSAFVERARKEQASAPNVVIVDCAIGGMDAVAWAQSRRTQWGTPWEGADRRLQKTGVTPRQVQVVWLKQALMGPARFGEFPAHARKLADDVATILSLARERYPSLRTAYLSSRIYAGYATTPLNPEPYAYESAFAVRRLIDEQSKGEPKLNWDPAKGPVKAPLLLWGPYLWGGGTTPRKADGLMWNREDLGGDGTHPSASGRQKVATLLLEFFTTDPTAKPWFTGKQAR